MSIHAEPRTFNRYVARDETTEVLTFLTQAKLVRVNRATQDTEPWLADAWTRSADGLRYTLKLRPNVTFSDGHPLTADDVAFSFEAVYAAGAALSDNLMVEGKKLRVDTPDPLTVVLTFPAPFAAGLRLLDNLPIYPRHRLDGALKAGTFAKAWGVTTPVADIVGLGPFIISAYQPGERVVLSRNARYWRKDAAGAPLPYLDRIVLEIVPDRSAELLRLESGQVDIPSSEMPAEDYLPLKRAADAGRVRLLDLGVGLDADALWFNLKPGAFGADPRAHWLQSDELRHAISMGVDRRLFADTVYLGAAVPIYGVETPGNKQWYAADAPKSEYDPARARAIVASLGGTADHPLHFTLITQKGNTARERSAAVIRDELQKVDVAVDVVALEFSAFLKRFLSGEYEAVYFGTVKTDTDPALNPDFWLSSGPAHVWNMGQASPATDWERRIDELMASLSASPDMAERKRLYDEVQRLFGEHQPMVYFAAPRIYVATSARVTNLTPALTRPQLLWSADTIAVRDGARATQ